MIYTGFYIIFIVLLSEFYKSIKLNLGIIIGIIILDLTIFLDYFNLGSHFHGNISHSIISITLIYIILLMCNEIINEKSKVNMRIINGIFIGMLLHITFDIILSVGKISFYWPLPISHIEPIYKINLNTNQLYIITIFHFFILRVFGYMILKKLLQSNSLPVKCYNNINLISKWIKLQSLFIIAFTTMYVLRFDFHVELINFCLLSSLTISVYFIYNIKEITSEDIIIG